MQSLLQKRTCDFVLERGRVSKKNSSFVCASDFLLGIFLFATISFLSCV